MKQLSLKKEDLRGYTDDQLLQFVNQILAQIGELTLKDKYELLQINDEFIRRQKRRQNMANELQKFKDQVSKMATGMTKTEAHQQGICIQCKKPNPLSRCHTEAGKREYTISGICEECWDAMFDYAD